MAVYRKPKRDTTTEKKKKPWNVQKIGENRVQKEMNKGRRGEAAPPKQATADPTRYYFDGQEVSRDEMETRMDIRAGAMPDMGIGGTGTQQPLLQAERERLLAIQQQQINEAIAYNENLPPADLGLRQQEVLQQLERKTAFTPEEQAMIAERSGINMNPVESTQAGAKILTGVAGGAAAGAAGGALGLGIGAIPGAVIGGILGGIASSGFVVTQIEENERQDVKTAMAIHTTAVSNMNNIINQANAGRPATEVINDFMEQERQIYIQREILKRKNATQVGADLSKSLDELEKIEGFIDYQLPYLKQKLSEAIVMPDPKKMIYNTAQQTEE